MFSTPIKLKKKEEPYGKLYRKFDKVPAVIDKEMIMDSILNSAPSTVCKKLFKRKRFEYDYVFKLNLDFKEILKIDHLWMLKNLKILSLAHNCIEVIENLSALVNLVQLDLSFNRIERIEGLEELNNIEVLSLYNNRIKVIENIDNLSKLSIFSIGNNQIENRDCILYLRRFTKLVSINMTNNPCTKTQFFKESLAAYIPSLLYYEYKLISQEERHTGVQFNLAALEQLEIEDTKRLKDEEAARMRQESLDFLADAFIEGLSTNQLFNQMFDKDFEGRAFKEIGEHTEEVYERLRLSVNEISMDICKVGEENYHKRLKEVEIFTKSWEENQKEAEQKAFHQQVELLRKWKYLVQLAAMFLKASANSLRSNDEKKLGRILEEFEVVTEQAKEEFEGQWYKLMEVEMKTYDKNEAIINLYESALSDIMNIFIEKSQTYFTLLRDSETDFIEDMTVKLNKYLVENQRKADKSNMPPSLRNIMTDKDSLSNAIIACHDRHTLAIDLKEDYIVSSLKHWHTKETGHLLRQEILRNRKSVLKIRDSVDKAIRLYETKVRVILNYFRTPEPLFVKTKKERRIKFDEHDASDEPSSYESSDESSDEEFIKKMKEKDYNEDVDWVKLLETVIEETESICPKYAKALRTGSSMKDDSDETEEGEEEQEEVTEHESEHTEVVSARGSQKGSARDLNEQQKKESVIEK